MYLAQSPNHDLEELVIHTGQHFDPEMSGVFFEELGLPEPVISISAQPGSHGASTGHMLSHLDEALQALNPDAVLVYGDTNSTLAGALAAAKLQLGIVHVEAGLRSFNMAMPEEINRVVTDRIANLNLAPSPLAMKNLSREGLAATALNVGDIMFDAVREASSLATPPLSAREFIERNEKFALVTLHRQENTDNPVRMHSIISELEELSRHIRLVIAVHPRLKAALRETGLLERVSTFALMIPPLSFLESVAMQKLAEVVITDSGGIQKESFYLETPCITLRDETEWPETISLGWNRLAPPTQGALLGAFDAAANCIGEAGQPYGDSYASAKIVDAILERFN